uniref:GrBNV_gp37-like protein n=1 Tax=Nilaparvata lugens endogenous nudivirus TaxID=1487700 RepID=X5GF14_9VIRU|nr:GrBNV_gp37-like protein [Nilaparvata lugens endogenous nudivirus]
MPKSPTAAIAKDDIADDKNNTSGDDEEEEAGEVKDSLLLEGGGGGEESEALVATQKLNQELVVQPTTSAIKRKITNISAQESISLLTFIQILIDISKNSEFLDDGKLQLPNIAEIVDEYVQNGNNNNCKQSKMAADDNTNQKTPNINTVNKHKRRYTYFMIILNLTNWFDEKNHILLFQREYLKYFLATYKRLVSIDDFINTNCIIRPSKKQKLHTPLTNGAILIEYQKSPELFASNLSRCNQDDVSALKLIIQTNIELQLSMYQVIHNMPELPLTYTVENTDCIRENYVRVPINNAKRAIYIVSKRIIIAYDHVNNQFQMPQPCVERDINLLKLSKMPYKMLVLDVLMLSNKMKIIDILGDPQLPNNYTERLIIAQKLFPTLKVVQPVYGTHTLDSSFLQKPNTTYGPVYVYYKPYQTVGVVGICNKQALIVYKNDEESFVYKTKAPLSGPSTFMLCTANQVKLGDNKIDDSAPLQSERTTIQYQNKVFNILDLPRNDIHLFSHIISIELRDNNKLGCVSKNDIALVSEYRSPTSKDITTSIGTPDFKDAESIKLLVQKIMKMPNADLFARNLINEYKQNKCNIELNY